MQITRRFFLQSSGALAAYLGVAPLQLFGQEQAGDPTPVAPQKTLVVIFLRGGVDGLNLVVPHGDPYYAKLRERIRIADPGQPDGAVDLDGFFGLHPRLGVLKPHFDSGAAVALHAVGYDRNSRSHFEEQDVWETGIVGNTIGRDGWLNRHLATSTGHGTVRAVAVGDQLPRILRGDAPAYAIRGISDLALPETRGDEATVVAALEHAYERGRASDKDAARDLLAQSGESTLAAIRSLRDVAGKPYIARAEYPDTALGKRLRAVACLIRADVGLEVAEVDYGGWDTHQNQGVGAAGTFGNLAGNLGTALNAFATDLGERLDDVLVLTLSDFGRTAAENGTSGTDHGWGNALLALGGPVARKSSERPGPVLGRWPGLGPDELHQKRDLLHTTDFRHVIAEAVHHHLGNPELEKVIPAGKTGVVGIL